MKSASSWRRHHGIAADGLRTDITSALQTGIGRSPVHTQLRPPGCQKGWEPARTFRFDTGLCLRYFGNLLAEYPVHTIQGVLSLEVTLGQESTFLLSLRRQGRLFHLASGVRRHIDELGIECLADRTGLTQELATLVAFHDAVRWVAVGSLLAFRPPQAGVPQLPRHSLRVRRTTPGEDTYKGWASTEYVGDLGVPIVMPDPYQVLSPWFGSAAPMGSQRRVREGSSALAGSGRRATLRRAICRDDDGVATGGAALGVAPAATMGVTPVLAPVAMATSSAAAWPRVTPRPSVSPSMAPSSSMAG